MIKPFISLRRRFTSLRWRTRITLWAGATIAGLMVVMFARLADVALTQFAAQSMLVTVWNLGIAGGGLAGGLLLQTSGVALFPWAVGGLMLLAVAATRRIARTSAGYTVNLETP